MYTDLFDHNTADAPLCNLTLPNILHKKFYRNSKEHIYFYQFYKESKYFKFGDGDGPNLCRVKK